MQLRVNPTRMVLLRLRRRLVLARRGQKLLKDKLEGLVQAFMPIVDEYGNLRLQIDKELPATLRLFALASALAGEKAVAAALEECETKLDVEMTSKSVMGVSVPELNLRGFELRSAYSSVMTTAEFDHACTSLREVFPELLRLASLEEALLRIAAEIEKTRRRVNALEYVLVPRLQETILAISSKLDENDRADRARLMKIKDMLQKAESVSIIPPLRARA